MDMNSIVLAASAEIADMSTVGNRLNVRNNMYMIIVNLSNLRQGMIQPFVEAFDIGEQLFGEDSTVDKMNAVRCIILNTINAIHNL